MSNSFKFIIIGILIIFIAFSNIEISYASSSPMSVTDNTTHVRLQTIINWLNNFLVYHYDYYNGIHQSNIESIVSKLSSISSTAALTDQKVEQIYYSIDGVEGKLDSVVSNTSKIKDYTNYVDDLEIKIDRLKDSQSVVFDLNYDSPAAIGLTSGTSSFQNRIYTIHTTGNTQFQFILPAYQYKYFTVYFDIISTNANLDFKFGDNWSINQNPNYYIFKGYQYHIAFEFGGSDVGNSAWIFFDFSNVSAETDIKISNITVIADPYLDYYKQLNSSNNSIKDAIDKIVSVYASDDLIEAKENQQNFEDQAISDFTGNGTAASSTSDINSLKGVSNTLKSGINTGGSVNNALSVFSNSNSIWDWFKQDNYNNINNQYNPNSNRLLRSNSGSDDIIDFYSQNQSEVFESLGD